MKRIIGTVAISVALVLPPGMLATAASASPPHLSAKLLSIGQMPTGWSVDNSQQGSGGFAGCLTAKPGGLKPVATAGVTFADGGSLPEVSEALAAYGSPINKAFSKLMGALDHCRSISMVTDGKKTTVEVGQMSFPHFGDQSAAFDFTFAVDGVNAGADFLVARSGRIAILFMELDLGSPDVNQFEGFVKLAFVKISG